MSAIRRKTKAHKRARLTGPVVNEQFLVALEMELAYLTDLLDAHEAGKVAVSLDPNDPGEACAEHGNTHPREHHLSAFDWDVDWDEVEVDRPAVDPHSLAAILGQVEVADSSRCGFDPQGRGCAEPAAYRLNPERFTETPPPALCETHARAFVFDMGLVCPDHDEHFEILKLTSADGMPLFLAVPRPKAS